MSGDEAPGKRHPAISLSVESMAALRDAFVIGHIEKLVIQLPRRDRPTAKAAEPKRELPPGADPHPNLTRLAIAALGQPATCIYIGRRYGLTPHAKLLLQPLEEGAPGARAAAEGTLCEAMSWLADRVGREAAARHLSEIYARLDQIEAEATDELRVLAEHTAGHVIATGSYSARIQTALGHDLTVAQNDSQVGYGFAHGARRRASLFMLHGSEQDFQNAMLGKTSVQSYPEHRPKLYGALSDLLRQSWIVLGAEEKVDATFNLAANVVSCQLGPQQRPIFVVDPRPEDEVTAEWTREALRHIRMTPGQFLSLAKGRS